MRLACALTALAFTVVTTASHARGAPDSFAELAEALLPTVVNISTAQAAGRAADAPDIPDDGPFNDYFRDFFGRKGEGDGPRRRVSSLGSGFIIDASGLVVTNNHVVADADEITVILYDDTELPADVVGLDPKTDLALLRVETDRPLPATRWGESAAVRVGDWIIAIGNPFGLGGSVTAGIVSARQRDINQGPYDAFIQTDASINRGNSGGPMFNLDGEVIGVNTAIFSPTGGSVGIGFAVPSDLARNVVDQIEAFGRTRRGWLGVRIQQVTPEVAETFGLDAPRGALVAAVNDEGPAALGGVEAEDVILRFNGQDVDEMRALPRIVAETRIGTEAEVLVWRKGAEERLTITVGELEEAEETGQLAAFVADEDGEEALDMTLSAVDRSLRERFDLTPGVSGLVVTAIEEGGAARRAGLRIGDVVLKVSQSDVGSIADLNRMITEARAAGRPSVLVLIDRKGELMYQAVSIDG